MKFNNLFSNFLVIVAKKSTQVVTEKIGNHTLRGLNEQ